MEHSENDREKGHQEKGRGCLLGVREERLKQYLSLLVRGPDGRAKIFCYTWKLLR